VSLAVIAVLVLVCVYSVYVAFLVVRAEVYTEFQKTAQLLVVILIPFLGPLLVHTFLWLHRVPASKPDRAFVRQEAQEEDVRVLHRHSEEP
jgi:hypothetical protein